MKRLILGVIAGFLALSIGVAQESESIDAKANVLAPITFPSSRDLDFEDVLPGVEYIVAPGHATQAGRFEIQGVSEAEVTLDFTVLPENLTGPGDPISITFSATDATHATNADYTTGATAFNPATGATTNLSSADPGKLYVAIGGTIDPPSDQAAGAYDATITLEVAYTGS